MKSYHAVRNTIVHKNILLEYKKDAQDLLPGFEGPRIKVALEELIPHLIKHNYKPPFENKGCRLNKSLWLSKFSNSLITVVDEVGINIIQEKFDFVFGFCEVNPLIKEIIGATHAFLMKGCSQESDVDTYDLLGMDVAIFRSLSDDALEMAESAFNDLAIELRKIILRKGMRECVKSFRRNATERYKQVMKVAENAWKKFSKILLIRLDWGLRLELPDFRAKFKDQEDFEEKLKEVDGYRRVMLKLLKKRYGSDLAFYVWKIEFGAQRGLHLHWMIGLNGSKHQLRINVPRAIAEMWEGVIDNDRSYIWNVNAIQSENDSILRVIDYDDPLLWEITGIYADYLTKVDYFLKLRMPGKMRSFGCTKFRNDSCQKRGSKRRKTMTEADIWKVRGPQGGDMVNGGKL